MTSVTEFHATERLVKTESHIDSVLIIQKQKDRLIRYGRGTMFTLMLVVVAAFVGPGYHNRLRLGGHRIDADGCLIAIRRSKGKP